jgi:hypothetical protein
MEYEAFFIASLKARIQETKASVVVIDNMTKVVAGSTDTAKGAIPIMNIKRNEIRPGRYVPHPRS